MEEASSKNEFRKVKIKMPKAYNYRSNLGPGSPPHANLHVLPPPGHPRLMEPGEVQRARHSRSKSPVASSYQPLMPAKVELHEQYKDEEEDGDIPKLVIAEDEPLQGEGISREGEEELDAHRMSPDSSSRTLGANQPIFPTNGPQQRVLGLSASRQHAIIAAATRALHPYQMQPLVEHQAQQPRMMTPLLPMIPEMRPAASSRPEARLPAEEPRRVPPTVFARQITPAAAIMGRIVGPGPSELPGTPILQQVSDFC